MSEYQEPVQGPQPRRHAGRHCPVVLAGVFMLELESDGAPLTMQIAWSRRRKPGEQANDALHKSSPRKMKYQTTPRAPQGRHG